jgi:hypothetical protein
VPISWIRRIQASPKATKPWIDRLQTHTVDFRQFLTAGKACGKSLTRGGLPFPDNIVDGKMCGFFPRWPAAPQAAIW